MAGVTYLPRLLQEGLGVGAAASGALLIPMTLALMVGSNLSGALFRVRGRLRATALASSVVIFGASLAFAGLSRGLTAGLVAVLAVALGFGVGVGMPVSNLAAQTGSNERDAGRATSMAMFFRGLGGTVSTAVCGMLAVTASASGTVGVFCAVGASAVVGAVAARSIAREIDA